MLRTTFGTRDFRHLVKIKLRHRSTRNFESLTMSAISPRLGTDRLNVEHTSFVTLFPTFPLFSSGDPTTKPLYQHLCLTAQRRGLVQRGSFEI